MDKDVRSSIFFSDNERYADIINGIGCDGVPFVAGKDLQEMDSKVNTLGEKGRKSRKQRNGSRNVIQRDLLRKTPFGVNFAIIGIENQEEIDYAMPLRIMRYDAGEYERQVAKIHREVRKEHQGLTAGEYLYGFRKDSRLFPTVTIVLYYGEKEWDGARDLCGMLDFSGIPDSLKAKVSNYRMHIVEVRKLTDTSVFKTDVKQVFDLIRCSKDKQKLKKLLKDPAYQMLEEDACDMVASYIGDGKMSRIKEKYKKGGKVDMCQGLKEWIEDERNEGIAEGKSIGLLEGKIEGEARFARLTRLLLAGSRTEELLRATEDKDYREQLYMENDL